MAQMIRKQVYIEPMQDTVLKKRSRMLGITEAEVIRRAIDTQSLLQNSECRRTEIANEFQLPNNYGHILKIEHYFT
ncbi:MAG: hypothetical protein C4B58_06140 [Deltaproteobacteria bacterium]|nr:MAG: hypothetical protein C4B58_06140 [Deltaproteobacteria bacterium]